METYVILRRSGWRSGEELEEAAARSTAEGERMSDDIRWIRSYVLEEGNGVGTVCIYQASSPEAIRAHAAAADLPVDEIIRVADTVLVRPDPVSDDRLREEIEMNLKKRALMLVLVVLPVLVAVGVAVASGLVPRRAETPPTGSTTSTRRSPPATTSGCPT